MEIVHVTMELFKTSGVSEFCKRISEEQSRSGWTVTVLVNHDYDNLIGCGVRVVVGSSLDDVGVRPALVHIHGLWSVFSARAVWWCRSHGVPYVISPHGCLMPRVFKKGRVKKHLFWWLFLRRSVLRANQIHCTSVAEGVQVRGRLGGGAPCIDVVPLGTILPQEGKVEHVGKRFRVLFLGRISDEKGLPTLLKAWKSIWMEGDELNIAGPDWRGFQRVLEKQIVREGIKGVQFSGNANAQVKDALFRSASVLVLSSPIENFSLVVIEALAHGVPVIATKGTPWGELEGRQCGWWIEPNSVEALARALKAARETPLSALTEMGRRGRQLVEENYTWKSVAREMMKGYEHVLHQ